MVFFSAERCSAGTGEGVRPHTTWWQNFRGDRAQVSVFAVASSKFLRAFPGQFLDDLPQ